eukprot:g61132.t1
MEGGLPARQGWESAGGTKGMVVGLFYAKESGPGAKDVQECQLEKDTFITHMRQTRLDKIPKAVLLRALWAQGPARRAGGKGVARGPRSTQKEGEVEEVDWASESLYAVWAEGEVLIGNVECHDNATAWVVLWHPYPLHQAWQSRDVKNGQWKMNIFKRLGPLYYDSHDGHYLTVNNALSKNNNVRKPVRCEMGVRYERGCALVELKHVRGKLTEESMTVLEEVFAGNFKEDKARDATSKCKWVEPMYRRQKWESLVESIKVKGIKPYLCWNDEGSGIGSGKKAEAKEEKAEAKEEKAEAKEEKAEAKEEKAKSQRVIVRKRARRMSEEVDKEIERRESRDSDDDIDDFAAKVQQRFGNEPE